MAVLNAQVAQLQDALSSLKVRQTLSRLMERLVLESLGALILPVLPTAVLSLIAHLSGVLLFGKLLHVNHQLEIAQY